MNASDAIPRAAPVAALVEAPSAVAFDPVFVGWRRGAYGLGILIWLGALAEFWTWWFQPAHIASITGFLVVTLVLLWITALPAYFIFIFFNAKQVRSDGALPEGRVAMVVTKAPSEPFSVVRKTLQAMRAQTHSHFDVWLADEDPSDETKAWCLANNVQISTRKDVRDYHRTTWPRRTRCKEGNLAYFYDHYGYERYEFVAQFDADHVPEPTYLVEVLRPFVDPRVGYVSAPSICDANAKESWAARGRLYAEASLHGSLQAGYNNGWAPLCIGSHYAVRTTALRQIGGLGPELAEDHSTTLMMNSAGWKGVHAVNAIAHGDGPASFADLAVQEFQWSRSLVTVLLQYSPQYVRTLSPRLKFQFLFSQVWYPLFSLSMLVMFLLPLVALIGGHPLVNVSYPGFLLHFAPISIVLTLFAFFWRASGTFRPYNAKLLGWEGIAFLLLRWPWSLAGSVMAVRDHLTRSFVDFRITPKGAQRQSGLPLRVLMPYVVLSGLCVSGMWLASSNGAAQGFHLFAALNLTIYTVLALMIVCRHAIENRLSLLRQSAGTVSAFAMLMAIFALGGFQTDRHALQALEALSHGQSLVSFTETKFSVAGAGLGGGRTKLLKFRFEWHGLEARKAATNDLDNV